MCKYLEKICSDPNWIWEAVGPDGIKDGRDDIIAARIASALVHDNPDELGRVIMGFARPYLVAAAERLKADCEEPQEVRCQTRAFLDSLRTPLDESRQQDARALNDENTRIDRLMNEDRL